MQLQMRDSPRILLSTPCCTLGDMKNIALRPGDRRTREAMREAHDDDRHRLPHPEALDVLAHWAECCADCNAIWRYEVAT